MDVKFSCNVFYLEFQIKHTLFENLIKVENKSNIMHVGGVRKHMCYFSSRSKKHSAIKILLTDSHKIVLVKF